MTDRMTREEAIAYWKQRSEVLHNWLKENEYEGFLVEYVEAIDMAIEALSEDISEDGTLKVKVKDGSKVNRVLVWGDNNFGGLYYPDEGNVQNMHNGMDIEQAIEWCKDCQHNEVCRYYPYDGCKFKDSLERPHGEWIEPQLIYTDAHKVTCTNCGGRVVVVGETNYCPNCGADMRGGK